MDQIQIPYSLYEEIKRAYESRALSLDDYPISLRVEDLQRILNIGRNTAYELVRSGKIRSVKVGRSIRTPRSELMRFLSENN